jgi:hypothetical protein
MGIKDVFNQAPTLEEEALYKQVLDEVESGVMRKGIYAKALADSSGDGGKAQSLYIKYRVQSLIDEEKHKAKLLGLKLAEEEKEKKAKEKKEKEIEEAKRSVQIEYEWQTMNIFKKGLIIFIGWLLILWILSFFDIGPLSWS